MGVYEIVYLAHVWRAKGTSVGRVGEIMAGGDSEPAFVVDIARVCVYLGKASNESVVFEYCLDEEKIGVAHNPQITSEEILEISRGKEGLEKKR